MPKKKTKKYTKQEAETDIINSPFGEMLGWEKKGKLTQAGKDVAKQYPSKKMVSLSNMSVKHHMEGKERWDAKFTNSRWGGKNKNVI